MESVLNGSVGRKAFVCAKSAALTRMHKKEVNANSKSSLTHSEALVTLHNWCFPHIASSAFSNHGLPSTFSARTSCEVFCSNVNIFVCCRFALIFVLVMPSFVFVYLFLVALDITWDGVFNLCERWHICLVCAGAMFSDLGMSLEFYIA